MPRKKPQIPLNLDKDVENYHSKNWKNESFHLSVLVMLIMSKGSVAYIDIDTVHGEIFAPCFISPLSPSLTAGEFKTG